MTAALREAVVTLLAALGCLGCVLALAPGPGPAVLAVVLCLSLSRSQLERSLRERIEAALVLPLVGLAATGVGLLLLRHPWLGAAAFVTGMFVSIWLRRFGSTARRAGKLLALPFVVLLVAPHLPAGQASLLPHWLLPIVIALVALLWVNALDSLARRIGLLPPLPPHENAVAEPARESTLRPIASTRMAIQMATALGLAFATGFLFFAERWAWVVLTAFIVLSGARGRLDVAYKSLQRVLGAAAGTVLALLLSPVAAAHGASGAALMLVSVFLGIWLRPLNYAWWALFVTIALALLQVFGDGSPVQVLPLRLEEILVGAVIGLACAWWLLPVRSTDVLRRRLADALAALAAAMDPAQGPRAPVAFTRALSRVQEMAPAFRAARRLSPRSRAPFPADWIDALVACRDDAVALIESGAAPGDVRRSLGATRKALRDPAMLLPALLELKEIMARQAPAPRFEDRT
ncbi:MAG TPA: FUSC family protein [Rhodanobacteraceae bacterium]|nr:FUSC family protein [Rhodanobacteraceae bacterium]